MDIHGGFLKWGVPPNHPNFTVLDRFSIETYGFGDPPFEEKKM